MIVRTCPVCGLSFHPKGFKRHARKCKSRPPVDELRRCYQQGLSRRQMGKKWGVTKYLATRWLAEAGIIEFPSYIRTYDQDEAYDQLVDPGLGLAPLWGQKGGCESCGQSDECWRRMRDLDLWPLCQVPTRREVALAYRDGRIGFDGNLPEWLPGQVKELSP